MKKNAFILTASLLLGLLLFTGCQKEITEAPIDNLGGAAASGNLANRNEENSCRLVSLDWPSVGTWQFHYNENGLADEWIIDFGFGLPLNTYAMTYDANDRLVQADEAYFDLNYVSRFYYAGERLVRLTRTNVDFPEDALDFEFTYNSKGQVTRQDDYNANIHVLMYYDALGNCTRTDLYFGEDLAFSDIYSFDLPIRNPRLHVPGVEIGFPFYGTGGFTDKWYFSSNKTIIYDIGNPILFNDYDPTETNIEASNKNLPTTAAYYDRVTETEIAITFDYDNCGGASRPYNNRYSHGKRAPESNKTISPKTPFRTLASLKTMKEQFEKLRQGNKMGIK